MDHRSNCYYLREDGRVSGARSRATDRSRWPAALLCAGVLFLLALGSLESLNATVSHSAFPQVIAADSVEGSLEHGQPALLNQNQAAQAVWMELPEDETRFGHLAVKDGHGGMLVFGGEAGQSAPAMARHLDLSADPPMWSELEMNGDVPVSRLANRGVLGASLASNEMAGELIMVCDCTDHTTYTFDLETRTWTGHGPAVLEQALWNSVLVHDPARDRALLIGGDLFATTSLTRSIQSLDLSAPGSGWQKIGEAPFELIHQRKLIDPNNGELILLGGQNADGELVDTAWSVDLASIEDPSAWRELEQSDPAPSPRLGGSLVLAEGESEAFLYGGYSVDQGGDFSDLWSMTISESAGLIWERIEIDETAPSPPSRSGHSAIWDAGNSRMVVHGGISATGFQSLGDTWSFGPPGEKECCDPIYLPILMYAYIPPQD